MMKKSNNKSRQKSEFFIKQISNILNQSKRDKRGELYNLFEVLNIERKEIMHSKMLGSLLDVKGTHGKKAVFLDAFLKEIGLNTWKYDTARSRLKLEKCIDTKNIEGGRIDIFLYSGSKCIAIENKIYAEDQDKQLMRYNEYCKKYKDYKIIYLTLFGNEATNISSGAGKVEYIKVSYHKEILKWLEYCKHFVKKGPLVVLIDMYMNTIKKITGDMEKNEVKLFDMMSQPENIESVIAILKKKKEWLKWIMKHACDKMNEGEEQKLEFSCRDNGCLRIQIEKEEKYIICFEYNNDDKFGYGIKEKGKGGTLWGENSSRYKELDKIKFFKSVVDGKGQVYLKKLEKMWRKTGRNSKSWEKKIKSFISLSRDMN
jgi:hypothetical protein